MKPQEARTDREKYRVLMDVIQGIATGIAPKGFTWMEHNGARLWFRHMELCVLAELINYYHEREVERIRRSTKPLPFYSRPGEGQ